MRTEFSFFRLTFGLLCLAAAAAAVVGDLDDYSFDVAWLWVAALAVVGIAGLASVVDSIRRPRLEPESVETPTHGVISDDGIPDDGISPDWPLDDDGPTVDV